MKPDLRPLAVAMLLALPARAEPPLTVDTVIAHAQAEPRTFTLTGEVVAHETLSAAFPTGGRITEMRVSAGDRVAKGATLAEVDSVQQAQAVRAAKAALATAEASYAKTRDDSERQDALLERGATTRSARDAAA